MKLFLASEAKHPETLKKLESFIGGFKGKKLAYIPTAANGEGWGSWKEGETWPLVNTLGMKITLVQLEDYRKPSVLELLQNKDIIWFAGGCPGYLMYWIRRTEIDKSLSGILEKGALYVGSSAGSMIASKNLETTEWFPNDLEIGASVIPGLGLVDFNIFPHYEDSLFEIIKSKYIGKKMYLLKNGEEIIVEDKKVTVLGEQRLITN